MDDSLINLSDRKVVYHVPPLTIVPALFCRGTVCWLGENTLGSFLSSFSLYRFSIKKTKLALKSWVEKGRLNQGEWILSWAHLPAIAVPSTGCCLSGTLSVREKSPWLVFLHDMEFCIQNNLKCTSCLHNLPNFKRQCGQTLEMLMFKLKTSTPWNFLPLVQYMDYNYSQWFTCSSVNCHELCFKGEWVFCDFFCS